MKNSREIINFQALQVIDCIDQQTIEEVASLTKEANEQYDRIVLSKFKPETIDEMKEYLFLQGAALEHLEYLLKVVLWYILWFFENHERFNIRLSHNPEVDYLIAVNDKKLRETACLAVVNALSWMHINNY